MNTNSDAIRILCYGDSNTWGQSDTDQSARYKPNVRWTGKLQELLGNGYEIIEEGLCGRTTVYDDPKDPGRNGLTYLKPCLLTHTPIDIVILMLGTNDLKERFNATAEEVSKNIEQLVKVIKNVAVTQANKPPKILLISPILFREDPNTEDMKGAGEKAKQFGGLFEKVATQQECEFIDMATVVGPGADGLHLSKDSHAKIAEMLKNKVLSL